MEYVIRKYQNRKFYDPQQSQMINLDGIARLVRKGEDIRVLDNDTDEDITAITLIRALLQSQRDLTVPLLGSTVGLIRALLRTGHNSVKSVTRKGLFFSIDAMGMDIGRFREIVDDLVRKGLLGQDEARELIAELGARLEDKLREMRGWVLATIDERLARYGISIADDHDDPPDKMAGE